MRLPTGMIVLTCLLLAGAVLAPGRALACTVCIPFPERTVIDHLIEAEAVVLARENPDRPFTYRAAEVLAGEVDTLDIDLFVPSSVRRHLSVQPERRILLIRSAVPGAPPRPGLRSRASRAPPAWCAFAVLTAAAEAMVRDVVARTPGQAGTPAAAERRAAYFVPYLAHRERWLRELAYLEVEQASYELITSADQAVPREQVFAYLEWRALSILLLGVDADVAERARVCARITELTAHGGGLNLATWRPC